MEINSLYFRIAGEAGENINNPLIASNENEMNNYLNDSKYNGKFVQYIGPDGIYKNNGIYKIENKSAILYTDTTDGTASSNDILLNKIAYSNGEKLIGTIESETIPEINQNTTLNTANKYITDNIIINIENKNPYIASSNEEMESYLQDTKYLGSFVKFTGISELYVTNEIYRIATTGNPTQYEPVGSTLSLKDILNIRNGQYLFYDCTTLTNDQLNSIIKFDDTENVTNMNHMFYSCDSLTTIPLLDTSKVTNMNSMFVACQNLPTIPLLDTSNVTSMDSMFNSCQNLTTIPLLNTSKVTNMKSMFNNCQNLTTIPLLDTSNVTNMSNMFFQCKSLSTVPLLDTSKVIYMNNMFNNCPKLTTIPFLDTSNATYMYDMFRLCFKITKIDITKLATSNGNSSFAEDCYSLKTLIIRTMDTIPSLYSDAFTNCYHFYGTVNATYNPDGLKDGRIYVPDDKVESLKAATNWSVFADIIVPLSTYVEEV